ncbi:hypothetical protein FNJ88_11050 [Chryseobacterium sp. SNU WT5]|uniref:hypothetical protein n=1 Tax=Chryseobacterium sp. SNU WT5 TaxID=2594269 RepID=UPI00118045D4|nr:hypothetical protein [Chryseobacterium sp. SNU WT5]QDP86056.1 hypothetical protein FNJ88_11050 [Chryseobacterium sp. SNU WT5]
MSWTKADLNKLQGKVKSIHIPPVPKNKVIIPKSIGKYKLHIIQVLKSSGLHFVEELQFDQKRKFRFDWAIPELMLGIEFEGIISEKSRHTTIQGFSTDCEKYNLCQIAGWKVLRYTVLNYTDFEKDLNGIICIFEKQNRTMRQHDTVSNNQNKCNLL